MDEKDQAYHGLLRSCNSNHDTFWQGSGSRDGVIACSPPAF
jgi:hypothetical protein